MSSQWERESNVECVVCPDCAFTFDAVHTDSDGGYSCPCCAVAESDRLKSALTSIERGVKRDPAVAAIARAALAPADRNTT